LLRPITVVGTLSISGKRLELVLIDGFAPQFGDVFDIMDLGSLGGGFGSIDPPQLPSPYRWPGAPHSFTLAGRCGWTWCILPMTISPHGVRPTARSTPQMLIAIQLVLERRTYGQLQYAHGDMDADGDIDPGDLLMIQQAVLQ
jgi:hypothetical protein